MNSILVIAAFCYKYLYSAFQFLQQPYNSAEKCRLSALRQVIFKWQFATVSDFQIKANTKTFVPFKCKEAEYKGK